MEQPLALPGAAFMFDLQRCRVWYTVPGEPGGPSDLETPLYSRRSGKESKEFFFLRRCSATPQAA